MDIEIFGSKKNNLFAGILIALFLVGIFFRTYHFHDLLRFNADQARDASLVRSVVLGDAQMPLLGPKAGGTEFKLGGAFYYSQIMSAKMFGSQPDKMAYPDLLFSILALPLLYIYLRQYFDKKKSIGMLAIFSVSFFAIKYSRFAWNPNSTPFWSILFMLAATKILSVQKESWKWALALGISLGVGVQLHTLLLVFLPLMVVLLFGYQIIKKRQFVRTLLIVLALGIFLNLPQIYYEYRTDFGNTRAFFGGVESKNKSETVSSKIIKDAVCFSQANSYILSGINVSDTCEIKSAKTFGGGLATVLGIIVLSFGFLASIKLFRNEKDATKKMFILSFLAYLLLAFIILVPLAKEISMRFFLVLAFMPLILLGFSLQYLKEKIGWKKAELIACGIIAILFASNFFLQSNELAKQLKYSEEVGGSFDNVSLKEIESLSAFIIGHSAQGEEVVLDGSPKYVSRVIKPIDYMTQPIGITILDNSNDQIAKEYFYIGNSNAKDRILKEKRVLDYKLIGRLAIYQIGL